MRVLQTVALLPPVLLNCSTVLALIELRLCCPQVPADTKAKVEGKLGDLKAALPSEDAEAIKAAMNALQQEVMAMGQAMYSQGGAPGPQPGAGGPGADAGAGGRKPGDDDVIDAEFQDSGKK